MQLRQFGFTYDTNVTDISKFDGSYLIEKLLNTNLSLNKYSNSIQRIVFVYLVVEPKKFLPRENFIKFRRNTATLEIGMNLDYYEFIQANPSESLQILALAYLLGIETYLSKQKDFNAKSFYADVQNLFEPILQSVDQLA